MNNEEYLINLEHRAAHVLTEAWHANGGFMVTQQKMFDLMEKHDEATAAVCETMEKEN